MIANDIDQIIDRMEKATVVRRRHAEAERKERIFDDKWRTIGVDKQALDNQMLEKQKLDDEAMHDHNAYEALRLYNSKVATIQNIREVKEKRAIEKDIVSFRSRYQQPDSRREFDLNDPDRLKKATGVDACVSIPGLVGEDVDYYDRMQRQKEQFGSWLAQQQNELEAGKLQQKLEDERDDAYMVAMDEKATQIQRHLKQTKKAKAIAIDAHNLARVEEKRIQEELLSEADHLLLLEHMKSLGVPGVFPTKDKRPYPESKQKVLQEHMDQIETKKKMELARKKEDDQHGLYIIDAARKALLLEREQARRSRLMRKNMDTINFKVSEIQQEAGLKRGQVYDSFFMQFNTCSR